MGSLKIIRIQTVNGEKHYIVRSLGKNENLTKRGNLDETDIKRIMKEEASKPLFLMRTE